MRVLITGATGFAGRHLAAYAGAQGAHVTGAGRRPAGEAEPAAAPAEYVQVDLSDREAARAAIRAAAPDRVFHLAAEASVALSWRDPAGTVTANMASTLGVLEAVRHEAAAARVLVCGSGEEYGEPERLPMEEDHPLRPRNPYALSKALTDLTGGSYADAFGLHVVRVRAFNHVGPGQSDFYVVSSFARQIAEAEAAGSERVEVVTGNIRTRRDFTDVRDVVRAYWMALADCVPGAYNVCSGRATATGDILAALARETDLEVVQRTDPELVREGEVMEIRGSHDRFTEQTGWAPEVPLEQTLRDTLGWWRERLPQGARA